MDICNLLDYHKERITSHILDVDDIIEDHLLTRLKMSRMTARNNLKSLSWMVRRRLSC